MWTFLPRRTPATPITAIRRLLHIRPRTAHAAYPTAALFFRGARTPPSQNKRKPSEEYRSAARFTIFTLQFFQKLTFSGVSPLSPPPAFRSYWRTQTRKSPVYSQSLRQWNKLMPIVSLFALTFQNHTNARWRTSGENCIFSHPIYLFLREFSLQDFRAFHFPPVKTITYLSDIGCLGFRGGQSNIEYQCILSRIYLVIFISEIHGDIDGLFILHSLNWDYCKG